MKMFCSHCGLQITNDRANFCKRCGNKLKGRNQSLNSTSNSSEDIFFRAKKKLVDFTSPKLEQTRKYTANKISDLQKNVEDKSKYKPLSDDQRTFLAQKLASLRDTVALKDSKDKDFSVEEAQELVTISNELLEQIKDDKCLICYKPLLQESKNSILIVCPHCGHGGHRNHIYEWFEKNKSCPYCKSNVTTNEILALNV